MNSTESTTSGDSQQPDDEPQSPSLATSPGDSGRTVIITEVHDPTAPSWSRARAILTGAAIGGFFGIIFFAAYGLTSAWICSARLDCGHWAPILIVSGIGAIASIFAGGTAGYVLHRMYRLFKVA